MFGAPGHQQFDYDGFIYIHYATPTYTSFRLAKFGWVSFVVCNAWQWRRTQNLQRVGENSGPTLSCLFIKDHEIIRRCRKPSYFPRPLADCLCHVSFRRNSPLSLEVFEKLNKCKFFGPQFLGGTTLTFLRQIVSAIYCPRFGKVWLSSVCWSPSAKSSKQWIRMQRIRRIDKNAGPVLSRLWTKVHDILRRCRRPHVVSNTLALLCISRVVPKT